MALQPVGVDGLELAKIRQSKSKLGAISYCFDLRYNLVLRDVLLIDVPSSNLLLSDHCPHGVLLIKLGVFRQY